MGRRRRPTESDFRQFRIVERSTQSDATCISSRGATAGFANQVGASRYKQNPNIFRGHTFNTYNLTVLVVELNEWVVNPLDPGQTSAPRMGETGFSWCEHIVTSLKNVKTLHEQIIVDIY